MTMTVIISRTGSMPRSRSVIRARSMIRAGSVIRASGNSTGAGASRSSSDRTDRREVNDSIRSHVCAPLRRWTALNGRRTGCHSTHTSGIDGRRGILLTLNTGNCLCGPDFTDSGASTSFSSRFSDRTDSCIVNDSFSCHKGGLFGDWAILCGRRTSSHGVDFGGVNSRSSILLP